MGCREVRNNFLLDEKTSPQWTYQKTGINSGVVYGELVALNREFKEIPCPDHCFDSIRITGFPREPFFYSRLFAELDRVLHPHGKLCFALSSPVKTASLKMAEHGQEKPDAATAEASIIYYGMKSGFTFTEKELSPGRPRKFARNQDYSLHLTLTGSTTLPTPVPGWETTEKSNQTLIWLIKGENTLNSEEDPSSES